VQQISTEILQLGLVQAIGRFVGSHDPDQVEGFEPDLLQPTLSASWYLALFEALNWTFTLDDRLRREFDSAEWHRSFVGGGLIPAFRYARNCVHHDWAQAFELDSSEEVVAPYVVVLGLEWNDELRCDRPNRFGEAAFAEHLSSRCVGDTLFEVAEVFEEAVALLHRVRHRPTDRSTARSRRKVTSE
jgi:hypothetical protein